MPPVAVREYSATPGVFAAGGMCVSAATREECRNRPSAIARRGVPNTRRLAALQRPRGLLGFRPVPVLPKQIHRRAHTDFAIQLRSHNDLPELQPWRAVVSERAG